MITLLPAGLHYGEVTASNLIKVDLAGNLIDQGTSKCGFQRTGYVIHSAIHEQRPELNAVVSEK